MECGSSSWSSWSEWRNIAEHRDPSIGAVMMGWSRESRWSLSLVCCVQATIVSSSEKKTSDADFGTCWIRDCLPTCGSSSIVGDGSGPRSTTTPSVRSLGKTVSIISRQYLDCPTKRLCTAKFKPRSQNTKLYTCSRYVAFRQCVHAPTWRDGYHRLELHLLVRTRTAERSQLAP